MAFSARVIAVGIATAAALGVPHTSSAQSVRSSVPPARDALNVDFTSRSSSPCKGLIDSSLRASAMGNSRDAEQGLLSAVRLCSTDAIAWRELAALHVRGSRWKDAQRSAERAIELAPDDARAWDVLARSRYEAGDLDGALRAWNRIGAPLLRSVETYGARRTRTSVIANLSGIRSEELITPETFARATRRVELMPISLDTQVRYEPTTDDEARLVVQMDEPDLFPRDIISLSTIATGALVSDELQFGLTSPTGHGEQLTTSVRWAANWRRTNVGLELPAPGSLPGLLSIDGVWEDRSFGPIAGLRLRERRTHAGVGFTDWATNWLAWQAGTGVDRFDDRGYVSLNGSLDTRFMNDHMALGVGGSIWRPVTSGSPFEATRFTWSARTATDPARPVLTAVAGTLIASHDAPLSVWPGAGASSGSDAPLRARSLFEESAVTGAAFGRRLVFASIEYEHPVARSRAGPMSIAGFVDTARAYERLGTLGASPFFVNIGVGLRIHVAGAGVVRVDIAKDLYDGHTLLSVGLLERWPRRWRR
jgi:hypothetical protein